MGISPDNYAARTGWSSRRAAYCRAARTSSSSRSGNSSTTCSAVSPAARRSSTSMTRIRIPRIHGRPPHCAGFTVMRCRMLFTGYLAVLSLHSIAQPLCAVCMKPARSRCRPRSRRHARCVAAPLSGRRGVGGEVAPRGHPGLHCSVIVCTMPGGSRGILSWMSQQNQNWVKNACERGELRR